MELIRTERRITWEGDHGIMTANIGGSSNCEPENVFKNWINYCDSERTSLGPHAPPRPICT